MQKEQPPIVGSESVNPKDRQGTSVNPPHTGLNAGTSDPTDGRNSFQWKTCYHSDAIVEIRYEIFFLSLILLGAHALIYATWVGWINSLLGISPDKISTLNKYSYYSAAGLLGGVTFGIKYFYRLVARGYWHQDRRIWRIMSPFISMTVALVVGAMIDCSLISGASHRQFSGATYVSIGFLSGYFADQAVGKMYEIAGVVFGKSASSKD